MQRYRHQDRGHRGNERLGRNANFSGMPRVGLGETKPPGILRKEGPFRRSTKPIEAGLDTRRLVSYSPRRLGNPIVEGAPVLLATVPWRDVLLESNRLLSDKVLKVFLKPDTIAVRRNRKLVRTKRLANGRCQRLDLVTGDVSIGPAVNMRGLRGNDPPELPVLSPDEALIRRNGAAWYDPALVELIRHGCAGDPLIEQIAIVLKSDLVEERALGNLYGEALANALAAQLLRRNYSPRANDLASKGGLGGRRLKLTLDYLEANLHSNLRIHELARRVGLSPNYFCSAFERSIGMPPHRWVLQRRIERAKNMLAERKTRLVEIADVLGFADQSHFSRLFRRFTGITPGRFRASL